MKRSILIFALCAFQFSASAQFFVSLKNLARRAGLFFTDDTQYKKVEKAPAPVTCKPLPAEIDFSAELPPVGNQLPQNSCVAWALGYACRSYYMGKQQKVDFVTEQKNLNYSVIASPSFIYNLLNNKQNQGTNLFRALNLLKDTGVCSYESMAYHKYEYKKQPSEKQLNEAENYRIEKFWRVDLSKPSTAVENLKTQLAVGTPVVIATYFDTIYYPYGHNRQQTSAYIWDTLNGYYPRMGHVVLLTGYSDSLKAFKFMNSWSSKWGNDGFGWISYPWASRVIKEAYIIKPKEPPTKYMKMVQGLIQEIMNTSDSAMLAEDESLEFSEMNTVTLLQRTPKVVNYEDIHLNGLSVHTLGAILERGKQTAEEGDGETELTFLGVMNIPKGLFSTFKVVVQFYTNQNGDKGEGVLSLEKEYQMTDGYAAATTDLMEPPKNEDVNGEWSASIPVSALDIPKGIQTKEGYFPSRVKLIAEPVLYIDDMAVMSGGLVEFELKY